jgi:hypothetical protein
MRAAQATVIVGVLIASLSLVSQTASARKLPCETGSVTPTAVTPIVVGEQYRLGVSFSCLEVGDELTDAVISWGDGSSSPGIIEYAQPQKSYVVVTPVTVRYANITGVHVFSKPAIAKISVTVTDRTSNETFTGHETVVVRPRDMVRPVPLQVRGRELSGAVAEIETAGYEKPTAQIDWGDEYTAGELRRLKIRHRYRPYISRYEIRGYHRWHLAGAHTFKVHVTDAFGHQHFTTVEHVDTSE